MWNDGDHWLCVITHGMLPIAHALLPVSRTYWIFSQSKTDSHPREEVSNATPGLILQNLCLVIAGDYSTAVALKSKWSNFCFCIPDASIYIFGSWFRSQTRRHRMVRCGSKRLFSLRLWDVSLPFLSWAGAGNSLWSWILSPINQ